MSGATVVTTQQLRLASLVVLSSGVVMRSNNVYQDVKAGDRSQAFIDIADMLLAGLEVGYTTRDYLKTAAAVARPFPGYAPADFPPPANRLADTNNPRFPKAAARVANRVSTRAAKGPGRYSVKTIRDQAGKERNRIAVAMKDPDAADMGIARNGVNGDPIDVPTRHGGTQWGSAENRGRTWRITPTRSEPPRGNSSRTYFATARMARNLWSDSRTSRTTRSTLDLWHGSPTWLGRRNDRHKSIRRPKTCLASWPTPKRD